MRTYAAARGAGKTTLCINKCVQYVQSGYEVYLVSPTKMSSDTVKRTASLLFNKDLVQQIHFIYAGNIWNQSKMRGVDRRRNTVVIFDDLDISLNGLIKEIFGSKAEVLLTTSTEERK